MKKFLSLLLLIIAIPFFSTGQEWVEKMQDPNINFYEVQESFNKYWEGKKYEKGQGWKQFKRWEYFMEPRVYPTGKRPNPAQTWKEYEKFKDLYSAQKTKGKQNKAANWTSLGPSSWNTVSYNPGIGRINCVAVHPGNSNIIYVGAPSGGCWRSNDGGSSWAPLFDDQAVLGVSGIAIHPQNPDTIFVATGDGDGADTYSIGVLRSNDGGQTWITTGLNWTTSLYKKTSKIIIHPTQPDTMWVASSDGVYRTTDGGITWSQTLMATIKDIELKPNAPNTVYASGDAFYKSTNSGASFSQITTGVPSSSSVNRLAIAVTPANSNYIYMLAGDASDGGFYGLYRSTNSGSSFSLRANTPNILTYDKTGSGSGGQSWYDLALEASTTNANVIYTGGINVWKSTDGGQNFNLKTHWYYPSSPYGYVHADIHNLQSIGNKLFCSSDGGVFTSTDGGNSWNDITTGIEITQFYRLGGSATNSGYILAGAQDNGCNLKNGTQWTHVRGADGMECAIDYSNINNMYCSSQFGTIYKSTNGGGSFSSISGSITESGGWVTPYLIDPNNPNTLFAGYENVWKSTNGGGTWFPISNFSGSSKIRALAVAPSNSNYIYAGFQGNLYKTTNGGSNWTYVSSGLPNSSITYITIHDNNPDVLWVSLSGFSAGQKVYLTTNGGSSWTNISGNLPNLPVNCITYEYGTQGGLYVGTDLGVYYTDSTLSNWQAYNTNLPNVIVEELEIHYNSGKIRAATHGRGIWESDIYQPTNSPPVAQFSASDTVICPSDSIQFFDQSLYANPQWKWYFQGGTPSTSNQQNPIVKYNSQGTFDVSLVVSNSNGNDSLMKLGHISVTYPPGSNLPLSEGFESGLPAPGQWSILNPDNDNSWEHSSTTGGFGTSSSSDYMDNFSNNTVGNKDYIISPVLDFSSVLKAGFIFDLAYARYSSTYSDTLAIYYTTDCGITKMKLWEKGGTNLSTRADYTSYFTPTSTEWRRDSVDISPVLGKTGVQFLFENRNGWGNTLYLDNINIISYSSVGKETLSSPFVFKAYPNPFESGVNIEFGRSFKEGVQIKLYNNLGQIVFEEVSGFKGNGVYYFEWGKLENGIYHLEIETPGKTFRKKLVKM